MLWKYIYTKWQNVQKHQISEIAKHPKCSKVDSLELETSQIKQEKPKESTSTKNWFTNYKNPAV